MERFRKLGILSMIVVAVCIITQAVVILTCHDTRISVSTLFDAVALLVAVVYLLLGYEKDAAGLYKLFFLIYAFGEIATVISVLSDNAAGIPMKIATCVLSGVVVVVILLLAAVKNLGKKRTEFLYYFVLTLHIISILIGLLSGQFVNYVIYLRAFAKLMLALLSCVLVYAKFEDKKARNREV